MNDRASNRLGSRQRYGILGVGAIATPIVDGFFGRGGDADFLLSPRGRATGSELSERHRSVRVCTDNQSVLDEVGTVLLCVRPQDVELILGKLAFRSDHVVISAMAGISVARLALLTGTTCVTRAIPLPSMTKSRYQTPIYPSNAAANDLFATFGGVLECADEKGFDALSAVTATLAAHFRYLQTISDWLQEHNISTDIANQYVATIFADLGDALRSGRSLNDLTSDHATPGGTNELFRRSLAEAGVFDEVRTGLARVFERVSVLPEA